LEDQLWYHGDISRADAAPLLKKDGDYLVRFSSRQQQNVLAVVSDGVVKNFLINEELSNKVYTMYCICMTACINCRIRLIIMSAVLCNNCSECRC